MTKQKKIIVLVLFVLILAFLAVTGYLKHPYTAAEIESDLAFCIADKLSEKTEPLTYEDINILATCANDKEMAFVFEKKGEIMSGFAVKSLLLPRYLITCGDMDSSDRLEENKDFDLSEAQNFRLSGYSEEHLYTYENGEFTLQSTTKRMNEDVKNALIRAVCGIGILCVVIFSKAKKED